MSPLARRWVKSLVSRMRRPRAASAPAGERPVRRFHLGLDWGTSTTKLVLRDYSHPERPAYVVAPRGALDDVRYPSAAALRRGRLRFGDGAAGAAHPAFSLKAMVGSDAFEQRAPGAARLTNRDLATLYLAHVLKLAVNRAEEIASRTGSGAQVGFTLGVPTEQSWERAPQAGDFLRLARVAYAIGVTGRFDPDGCSEAEAEATLRDARASPAVSEPAEFGQWLRPEVASATLWPMRSPSIEPGLYTCVDVGAWTVNASYFRIRHDHLDGDYVDKGGLSFYGGACAPPSMNRICEILAQGARPEALWGREEQAARGREPMIQPVLEEMAGTWKRGFQRAYRKEALEERWEHLRVLPIGGGSRVRFVRDRFRLPPNAGTHAPRMIDVPATPRDLFDFPRAASERARPFEGEAVFMLVAYGLSVREGEFPSIQLADEVSDLGRKDMVPARRTGRTRCKCGEVAIPGTDRCFSCE